AARHHPAGHGGRHPAGLLAAALPRHPGAQVSVWRTHPLVRRTRALAVAPCRSAAGPATVADSSDHPWSRTQPWSVRLGRPVTGVRPGGHPTGQSPAARHPDQCLVHPQQPVDPRLPARRTPATRPAASAWLRPAAAAWRLARRTPAPALRRASFPHRHLHPAAGHRHPAAGALEIAMSYDIIIKNGLYFDGTGAPGVQRHVGIRNGRIDVLSLSPLDESGCANVIDATGKWLTPGFLEIHSHYDAEVIAAPALKESVRHGVTTVTIGSCSISMVLADAEDCSDLFTRVEAVPREYVLPILQEKKTWRDAAGYRAFYDQLELGPNVSSFLGHSELRVAVMGLERATSPIKPTEAELQRMEQLLEEALDAGCIGLSVMTTRLDKMDGDRAWSSPLPSTFATWKEFSRLFAILRRRGAVMQGAP